MLVSVKTEHRGENLQSIVDSELSQDKATFKEFGALEKSNYNCQSRVSSAYRQSHCRYVGITTGPDIIFQK